MMERVWMKKKGSSGDPIRFPLVDGKLSLRNVAEYWDLHPARISIGPDVIRIDAEGRSVETISEIRELARETASGDGMSKESPFIVDGAPAPAPASAQEDLEREAKRVRQERYTDEACILKDLLGLYKEKTQASRSVSLQSSEYDPGEPGNNFEIRGRMSTYETILKGVGEMYKRFCQASPNESTYRAGPFFLSMIAFPGAGKTTLGSRGYQYLVDCWNSVDEETKAKLLNGNQSAFRQLVEKSFTHMLLMYHEVENSGGRVVFGEKYLSEKEILGLRALYMIIFGRLQTTRYSEFLGELDEKFHGLKHKMTFEIALRFLSAALELSEESKYMAAFFFDEVNAVDCTIDGEKATDRHATWFQLLMSEYVKAHYCLAQKKFHIFPVLSIATTRFSAGDMRFTESRKSCAVIVPFPPLDMKDAQETVLLYLQNLAKRVGRVPPEKLTEAVKHMIRLSGGMPRYISLGLRALSKGESNAEKILEMCTKELQGLELGNFLKDWEIELNIRSEFAKYSVSEKYPAAALVLKKALAASLLGKSVRRIDEVSGGIRWADLESSGIVALTSCAYTITDDAGQNEVSVKLCPILFEPLVKKLGADWPVRWPPLTDSDWRKKEIADILSILLRIYLLEDVYHTATFKIKDVVSQGAFIPDELLNLNFRLKDCTKKFQVETAQQQEWACARLLWETHSDSASGVMGPGNYGADWVLFCEHNTLLIGQSKKSEKLEAVTSKNILDSYEADVGKLFKLPSAGHVKHVTERAEKRDQAGPKKQQLGLETEPLGVRGTKKRSVKIPRLYQEEEQSEEEHIELPSHVYIYCTTKPISTETLCYLDTDQDEHPWLKRIVVVHETPSTVNDPLSLLSFIRKLPPL